MIEFKIVKKKKNCKFKWCCYMYNNDHYHVYVRCLMSVHQYHIHTNMSYCKFLYSLYMYMYLKLSLLKPQDSFSEFDNFFPLIFRKCRKSSENTIRPSCNCFEWHIVMQYCPVVNYHYVHVGLHNLWQSVRGDSKHFYVNLDISWKWKHFWANC